MDMRGIPKQGEIYNHFKDKPYQIITVATHTETGEQMVVYQALYGDYKTYVRPLAMFMSEVDKEKYPDASQKYRFELKRFQSGELVDVSLIIDNTDEYITKSVSTNKNTTNANELNNSIDKIQKVHSGLSQQVLQGNIEYNLKSESTEDITDVNEMNVIPEDITDSNEVNVILLRFLDAESYNKKLEILTSNLKHITDRLINDMAASLDCTVDEGPLDQRIQGLINCLQAMCRFEDRRLR